MRAVQAFGTVNGVSWTEGSTDQKQGRTLLNQTQNEDGSSTDSRGYRDSRGNCQGLHMGFIENGTYVEFHGNTVADYNDFLAAHPQSTCIHMAH